MAAVKIFLPIITTSTFWTWSAVGSFTDATLYLWLTKSVVEDILKNLKATWNFEVAKEWHETSSILTHSVVEVFIKNLEATWNFKVPKQDTKQVPYWLTRCCRIFYQKSGSHLKFQGGQRVTWNKFHTDSQCCRIFYQKSGSHLKFQGGQTGHETSTILRNHKYYKPLLKITVAMLT